jgi:hypothetical protein
MDLLVKETVIQAFPDITGIPGFCEIYSVLIIADGN